MSVLSEEVRFWIDDDPDMESRQELQALLDTGDEAALRARFSGPLDFGTAGLRGLIGAGPSRMNIKTVIQASAAVAKDALNTLNDAAQRGVVIGRDGRRKSDAFARAAAEVFAGYGFKVYWIPQPAPTPVAAFMGKKLQTALTCVVTASHNPPDYNGFKVYNEKAAQIIPPQDARIRAEREKLGTITEIPRIPFVEAVRQRRIEVLNAQTLDSYFDAIAPFFLGPDIPPAQLVTVTTSLHGVGHPWLMDALVRRGHQKIYSVLEQASPDGRFPTVSFPNPEEDGALDLALALARKHDAELILANDPDADRLSVTVADPTKETGYRTLSGNEIGLLLADWVLSEGPKAKHGAPWPEAPLVASSLVSTLMLAPLAESYGVRHEETLTGFKWIWGKALEIDPESFVFGFEEAIGYCVGHAVRDKDGISAAVAIMDLAAHEKSHNRTLLDRLDSIAARIGVSHSSQIAVMYQGDDGLEKIAAIMAYWRKTPPTNLAALPLTRSQDLLTSDAEKAGVLPSNVLIWHFGDQLRVIARPSGTEPKIKVYIESRIQGDPGAISASRSRARDLCQAAETTLRDAIASIT